MKSTLVAVAAFSMMMLSSALAQTSPGQASFVKGMRAVSDGDTAAAKTHLTEALAADPRHRQAALLLQRIQMKEREGDGGLEQRAAAVIIPTFAVKDVSLSSVLDNLQRAAAEYSGGPFALNLVRLFTPEFGEETKVTLSLNNAPLSEILRYVAQMSGLDVQYQQHAVVLSPPQSARE